MEYEVKIIADDDLSPDVQWLFVRREGCLAFWLRESTASKPESLEAALQDAWEAFRSIQEDELFSWPTLEPA